MEHAGHPDRRADATTDLDALTSRHIVIFRLGSDTFALPVEPVAQILPMLAITPLPQDAGALVDSVLGAIDLRGQVVPVVDLCRHIGLPHIALERDTPLIVARACGLTVSLIVDEVVDVVAVSAADITLPGAILPDGMGQIPLIAGIVRVPGAPVGRLALLLDAEQLFAPNQREALVHAIEMIHEQGPSARVGVP
ncbi:MAG: chemotaxis protein CheW [Anaerolineae bacterium]|nr:chemotaxis protein CheW [Anaerolineae bacterium]